MVILVGPRLALAQTFDEQFAHWPVQLKINGRIIVNAHPGEEATQALAKSLKGKSIVVLQGDESAKDPLGQAIQNLEMAPPVADDGKGPADDDSDDSSEAVLSPVSVVSSWTKLDAAQLTERIGNAEVVHIGPLEMNGKVNLALYQPVFQSLLGAGKTLIVDPSMAPWLGSFRAVTSSGRDAETALRIEEGWALIPDGLVWPGFTEKSEPMLRAALNLRPRSVGIGIRSRAHLFLDGRKFWLRGDGSATFLLAANERQPVRRQMIEERKERRQPPETYLVDLTEWRRDAIDRTLPAFPPRQPPKPVVPHGTLFIVGGGGLPEGMMERFVEAAGGKSAKLVYVPCSEREDVGSEPRIVQLWRQMGVEKATFVHTKDRIRANSDPSFFEPLSDATGIWFGGGRQWNFSDSYYGTQTHRLMKEVLRRGGVIGGSSAGASIQARYLARATPIDNFRPMAPGYERGGLGFIGGVAIDQHFSQRRRHPDMTSLVNRYPQLLGIGIDETTALIVSESRGEVVGQGKVHFYDRTQPVYPDRPDFIALSAGSIYDLAERKVIVDSESE